MELRGFGVGVGLREQLHEPGLHIQYGELQMIYVLLGWLRLSCKGVADRKVISKR